MFGGATTSAYPADRAAARIVVARVRGADGHRVAADGHRVHRAEAPAREDGSGPRLCLGVVLARGVPGSGVKDMLSLLAIGVGAGFARHISGAGELREDVLC